MADNRGWYNKFNVTRTDGSDAPGQKHFGCEYLVLDLWHDPHAMIAVQAYAEAIREARPALSKILAAWATTARPAPTGTPEADDASL